MRVWLDTDIGDNPDDSVAVLLAHHHPAIDLVGVSTVSGDVEARAERARELVGGDIPVVAGSRELAGAVTGADVDALVAIGPLTNVAMLLESGAIRGGQLVVMGGVLGSVYHRGRERTIESNFAADPVAAGAVIEASGVRLVTLDVTAALALTDEQVDRLLAAWPELEIEVGRWSDPVVLHDPMAVLAALDEAPLRWEWQGLSVGEDGRLSAGDASCRVGRDLDVATVIDIVLTRLG